MRSLIEGLSEDKRIQEYVYDCLKASWKRMISLQETKTEATHPWRTGEMEVNIIGVRGLFLGEVREKNVQGQYDDMIFVARIERGLKVVYAFDASLDYSTGRAPILLEGCYRYFLAVHNTKYFVTDSVQPKKGEKEGIGYGEKYDKSDTNPPTYEFPPEVINQFLLLLRRRRNQKKVTKRTKKEQKRRVTYRKRKMTKKPRPTALTIKRRTNLR
ncbi:MAG: hypothetical protein IPN71_13545 [Fibrobacteres bacterium]|nr:hypothetical protein [Fibrobacterota bacterium]